MQSHFALSILRGTMPRSRAGRRALIAFGSLALLVVGARCGSDSTGTGDPLAKVPDFLFVSNASGSNQIYTWRHGSVALFPGSIAGDVEPQSAFGKVVFTSYRISFLNPEIYIANSDGSNMIRLTDTSATDHQPSLSPDGGTVVFTSTRSGTSRIWIMNADGSNQVPLNTGSTTDIPESNPRYSTGGGRILFSSPRSNTSQIWIVPAAGGAATQVTHEINGAFNGSWSPDGNSIYYIDGTDRAKIHNIVISTGVVTDYVTGGHDVGEAACSSSACLVVTSATAPSSDIYAYIGSGDANPLAILIQSTNDYQPAILH